MTKTTKKVLVTVDLASGGTAQHVLDCVNGFALPQEADNWASSVSLNDLLDAMHGEGAWENWEVREIEDPQRNIG